MLQNTCVGLLQQLARFTSWVATCTALLSRWRLVAYGRHTDWAGSGLATNNSDAGLSVIVAMMHQPQDEG